MHDDETRIEELDASSAEVSHVAERNLVTVLATDLNEVGVGLVTMAAGYGATLIPALAADSLGRLGIALRPLTGETSRTIRLASRPGFPRPQALRALEKIIRLAMGTPRPEGRLSQTPVGVENRAKTLK